MSIGALGGPTSDQLEALRVRLGGDPIADSLAATGPSTNFAESSSSTGPTLHLLRDNLLGLERGSSKQLEELVEERKKVISTILQDPL
jgi:hypothetical protein